MRFLCKERQITHFMYQFEITANEAGQRFDKYLHKLLPKAPTSFFYKMLRKKNIVLNEKKAEGKEKLCIGDVVKLFLAEETFVRFAQEDARQEKQQNEYRAAYEKLKGIEVIFENQHMLLVNKPSGILTQKAKKEDLSLNEWLIGYLLFHNRITEEMLATFKPSVCNRLDRNTGGIVICAKSLAGSQELSRLIAERKIRKFYRLFVKGFVPREETLEGYLHKDERTNTVSVTKKENAGQGAEKEAYIKTRYYPLKSFSDCSYLEAELITGKTHQIRAHLASAGHPLLGDYKYGDKAFNDGYRKKYGITGQLLHAYRLEFQENELLFQKAEAQEKYRMPEVKNGMAYAFTAKEPAIYQKLLKEAGQK